MPARAAFSNGEASEIIGVSPTSIEQWCRAGLIHPEQRGRGRGHHRRFDGDDLTLMMIARELSRAGLSLPQLQQAFTVLRVKLDGIRPAWRSAMLFRDYIETIKLLARTFGRGDSHDAWLRDATAHLSRMQRAAKGQDDSDLRESLVAMSRVRPSGVSVKAS